MLWVHAVDLSIELHWDWVGLFGRRMAFVFVMEGLISGV